MYTDLIIVREYCEKSQLDPTFLYLLEEGGLIDIYIMEGEQYLYTTQLPDLEKYTRMYYDLSINIEGIDAIRHLLERITSLRNEITDLTNQLRLYQGM